MSGPGLKARSSQVFGLVQGDTLIVSVVKIVAAVAKGLSGRDTSPAAVYLMMCCVLVAVRAGHRRGKPCRVLRGHLVVSRSRIPSRPVQVDVETRGVARLQFLTMMPWLESLSS